MEKINVNQKIGDIVNQFPKVADIFKEYKIDYCCGGDRPLKSAIEAQNIDESNLLNKINHSFQEFLAQKSLDVDWLTSPLDNLVDHILDTHHAYLNANLPIIHELVTKIMRVHGERHPELIKVHKLFSSLRNELESHLFKEETVQYPAIRAYLESNQQSDLETAVSVNKELSDEHTAAGDILKEFREVTNDYHLPDDACGTYAKTYEKLQELEADMFQHIHLENNILFPRLENLLKS